MKERAFLERARFIRVECKDLDCLGWNKLNIGMTAKYLKGYIQNGLSIMLEYDVSLKNHLLKSHIG